MTTRVSRYNVDLRSSLNFGCTTYWYCYYGYRCGLGFGLSRIRGGRETQPFGVFLYFGKVYRVIHTC